MVGILNLNIRPEFTNSHNILLITFPNSLDPDQAWQDAEPDLNPNCGTDTYGIPKIIFLNVYFEKKCVSKELLNAGIHHPEFSFIKKSLDGNGLAF